MFSKQKKLLTKKNKKIMSTLDLSAYGVQEMDHQEMIETDGGIFLKLLALAAIAVFASGCVQVGSNNEATIEVKVEVVKCNC